MDDDVLDVEIDIVSSDDPDDEMDVPITTPELDDYEDTVDADGVMLLENLSDESDLFSSDIGETFESSMYELGEIDPVDADAVFQNGGEIEPEDFLPDEDDIAEGTDDFPDDDVNDYSNDPLTGIVEE